MRQLNRSKGFTLIELIVVIAVIGVLVLLAAPKLLSYTEEAKLAQIKNDAKVVEDAVHLYMVDNDDQLPEGVGVYLPEDLDTALGEMRVFNSRGVALEVSEGDYFDMTDDSVVNGVNTKLGGRFIANDGGDVYYVHSDSMGVSNGDPDENVNEYRGRTIAARGSSTFKLVNGSIYTWGNNYYGALGLGDNNNRLTPEKITDLEDSEGNTIMFSDFMKGVSHSFAISKQGDIYSWGANAYGQLGDETTTDSNIPKRINLLSDMNIKDIKAGNNYSLALTKDGNVYSWGSNTHGQLGRSGDELIPQKISIKDNHGMDLQVVDITASSFYSLALTDGGDVYSWGYNGEGRTGLGIDTGNTLSPQKVNITDTSGVNEDIIEVIAGGEHSLAIASNGNVYGWGNNTYGQLVHEIKNDKLIPVLIDTSTIGGNIIDIAAGHFHTLALTDDGAIYSWGMNQMGQLGLGDTTHRSSPQKVTITKDGVDVLVKELSAGTYHSMALAENGDVYIWGWNGNGQLGDGTNIDKHSPTLINIP